LPKLALAASAVNLSNSSTVLLPYAAARRELGISRYLADQHIRAGRLRAIRAGRNWFVPHEDVLNFQRELRERELAGAALRQFDALPWYDACRLGRLPLPAAMGRRVPRPLCTQHAHKFMVGFMGRRCLVERAAEIGLKVRLTRKNEHCSECVRSGPVPASERVGYLRESVHLAQIDGNHSRTYCAAHFLDVMWDNAEDGNGVIGAAPGKWFAAESAMLLLAYCHIGMAHELCVGCAGPPGYCKSVGPSRRPGCAVLNYSNSNGLGAHVSNALLELVVDVHPSIRRMGALVFPLFPLTKKPLNGSHGFRDAVPTDAMRKKAYENYGVYLGDHLVVVDFDCADLDADPEVAALHRQCVESVTWRQRTGGNSRCEQFVFRTTKKLLNAAKIRGKSGKTYGDFKSGESYIVGPNSVVVADKGPYYDTSPTYTVITDADPVELPETIQAFILACAASGSKLTYLRDLGLPVVDSIAFGEHRSEISLYMISLRKLGYSDELILSMTKDAVAGGHWLTGHDPKVPFRDAELRKLITGIKTQPEKRTAQHLGNGQASHSNDAGYAYKGLLADAFVPALSLDFANEQGEVFVEGMVWRGALHVFYGAEKIGKTGAAGKVLALITQKGYDVAIVVSEDRPQDVVKRIIESGGVPGRIHVFNEQAFGGRIVLPDDEDALREFLLSANLGCLYFDSVMDHRKADTKPNAADDARAWAGALHRIALATKTAIIGTCHLNMANSLEGARQIKCKARAVVRLDPVKAGTTHTTCAGEPIGPFPAGSALVAKTESCNGARPGTQTVFGFVEVPSVNPLTGIADLEKREDGSMGEAMLFVCDRMERLKPGYKLPPETNASRAKRAKRDEDAQLAERRLELADWLREHHGRHANDVLIATGIVNKNNIAATVNDPMFKRTTEKGTKYTELAELAVA
jgi:hypothetical protein